MQTTFTKQIDNNSLIKATIKLADDCSNGHRTFSITGEIYEDSELIACGCLHKEILKHFPELKLFINLHLCEFNGTHLYAIRNSFYLLKKENKNYLDLPKNEFDMVKNAEDQDYFQYLLETKTNYLKRQKEKAKTAICELEIMTKKKSWKFRNF